MTEIIMQAYDVLDEIKKDEIYLEIKTLNQQITKLYDLEIKEFNELKALYQDILDHGGTYHPDYKDVIKKMSISKKNLYEKEEVKRYLELEKQFEREINEFLSNLSHSVSDYIQTPNKLGIVSKGGSCHVG